LVADFIIMKNMKKFIMLMTVVFVAACSEDKKTLATPSTSPDPEEVFSAVDSPLYFQLGSRWEMDGEGSYELAKACEIPKLAPVGTSIPCHISVPEAKLYFSNLKFVVGTTMPAVCPRLIFSAYYYRRSNEPDFNPAGQTEAINCSNTATKDDRRCYGGAAPAMFSDFPGSSGRYFNTNLKTQSTFDLPSENSTRWYGGSSVNYLTTNIITDPTLVVTGNDADARAGQWQDYSVSCRDIWNEPIFEIEIFIQDENYDTTGSDHFTDWP
jgi:hypothetical protein